MKPNFPWFGTQQTHNYTFSLEANAGQTHNLMRRTVMKLEKEIINGAYYFELLFFINYMNTYNLNGRAGTSFGSVFGSLSILLKFHKVLNSGAFQ